MIYTFNISVILLSILQFYISISSMEWFLKHFCGISFNFTVLRKQLIYGIPAPDQVPDAVVSFAIQQNSNRPLIILQLTTVVVVICCIHWHMYVFLQYLAKCSARSITKFISVLKLNVLSVPGSLMQLWKYLNSECFIYPGSLYIYPGSL